MAQTKKRRKRKRRGTQGGGLDRHGPRGRPRNRQEAKARAQKRARSGGRQFDRRDYPPTWSGAIKRGLVMALIFSALMYLLLGRGLAEAAALGVFMLALYIPMGYFIDRLFYNRRQAQLRRQRETKAAGSGRSR